MSGYAKIIIMGRVGKDPEIKSTKQGMTVASFSIAVSFKLRGLEQTEWHRCTAFDRVAGTVEQYLKKGDMVLVEGRPKTGEYERDGQKHRTFEVVVSHVTLIGGGGGGQRKASSPAPYHANDNRNAYDTDDIPF